MAKKKKAARPTKRAKTAKRKTRAPATKRAPVSKRAAARKKATTCSSNLCVATWNGTSYQILCPCPGTCVCPISTSTPTTTVGEILVAVCADQSIPPAVRRPIDITIQPNEIVPLNFEMAKAKRRRQR
jgi:hypothetical protein